MKSATIEQVEEMLFRAHRPLVTRVFSVGAKLNGKPLFASEWFALEKVLFLQLMEGRAH